MARLGEGVPRDMKPGGTGKELRFSFIFIFLTHTDLTDLTDFIILRIVLG